MRKRLFDILLSGIALIAASPFLLLISFAIKLEDRGPAFFAQTRVGRHGRLFELYKLRSMRVPREIGRSSRLITIARDERVTKIGRVIRLSKIDEIPQLVNVLKGDMSIVGPRPEVPKYVSLWDEELRNEILSVRPGITDPASVVFRDESKVLGQQVDPMRYYEEELIPTKTRMYAEYVRAQTFRGDVRIVIATIRAVLGSR
ncbi:sugar transferase [Paramicrobacterium fandaimingii]|uniref:sugar transferase n=1 Tax=Paramicrobacterium fandaimingii TaxID=2708079 RepID=UPI001420E4CD|nr:sugar transferase [Microbacterium fandaimingii]